jgi:hypothetical protein
MTLFDEPPIKVPVWTQVTSGTVLTVRLTCSKQTNGRTNKEIDVAGNHHVASDWAASTCGSADLGSGRAMHGSLDRSTRREQAGLSDRVQTNLNIPCYLSIAFHESSLVLIKLTLFSSDANYLL